MKKVFLSVCLIITWFFSKAQTEVESDKKNLRMSIGSDGVNISKGNKNIVGKGKNKNKSKTGKINHTIGFDLGFVNFLNPQTAAFPATVSPQSNGTLNNVIGGSGTAKSLELNNFKSMNVGLYPLLYSLHLDRKASVNLIMGLGFNWHNLRYTNDVRFNRQDNALIDSLYPGSEVTVNYYANGDEVSKSKMAASYLTVPLMLQVKPKVGANRLVIGGGVSAGYLVKGWYKMKESGGGKERTNQTFAFNPWQLNVVGEFGIDDKIRFYGSYGLTELYKKPMDQKTFTVGVRFFGL
jgi:hypothetical protein